MDMTESTIDTLAMAFEDHTSTNVVDMSDFFEGDDIYSDTPFQLRGPKYSVPQEIPDDTIMADTDNCFVNTSMDTSDEDALPAYFSDNEHDGSTAKKHQSMEQPAAGTIDLDYDSVNEATAGVQSLHVSHDPTTGSNGGGSS